MFIVKSLIIKEKCKLFANMKDPFEKNMAVERVNSIEK